MFNYHIFNSVVSVICGYLDITDLKSCTLVDVGLSKIIRKYMGRKYTYQNITPYSRSIRLWTDKQPDRPCTWIKRVVCYSRMISCGKIARLFPNITELEMKFSRLKGYKWLVNLRTLVLHNDYPGTVKQVFRNCSLPKLEKLVIKFYVDLDLGDRYPNLKHIEMIGSLTIGKNRLQHIEVEKFYGKAAPDCYIRETVIINKYDLFPNNKQICTLYLGKDRTINNPNLEILHVNGNHNAFTISTTTQMPKCRTLCLYNLRDYSIINWCPNVTKLDCEIMKEEFKTLINLETIDCKISEFDDFTCFAKLNHLTVYSSDGAIRSNCTELRTSSKFEKLCPRVIRYIGDLPLPQSDVLREFITYDSVFGTGCYPTITKFTFKQYFGKTEITGNEITETFPNLTHIRVNSIKVSKKFHSDKIIYYHCKKSTCIMENFPNATRVYAKKITMCGPKPKLEKLCAVSQLHVDNPGLFPRLTNITIDIGLSWILQYTQHLQTLKLLVGKNRQLPAILGPIIKKHKNLTRIKLRKEYSLDWAYKKKYPGIAFHILTVIHE
jgi:hypothetical protein